jgi:hypothetical protein
VRTDVNNIRCAVRSPPNLRVRSQRHQIVISQSPAGSKLV